MTRVRATRGLGAGGSRSSGADRRAVGLVARALMAVVSAYRLIPKPGMPRCRFYPSCSAYALEALERHGAMRGGALAVARVARCHPFNPGGIDPVPDIDATRGRARRVQRREGVAA